MKKIKFILSVICCVLCAFIFVGCNKNNTSNNTTGNNEKEQYSITLETSDDYTISCDKTTAKPYEMVKVSVTLNTIDKKISYVEYGTQLATKNSDGTYKFYMPKADTKVSVVLTEFKEKLKSANSSYAFASYSIENKSTLYTDTGDRKLFVDLKATNMTILKTNIYSSNKTAIPEDAISIEYLYKPSSNIINDINIVIDTTKVSKGYSWIEIEFKNENVPSEKGTIVFKLKIEDKINIETCKETLVFDLSLIDDDLEDATFRVTLSDFDYDYGMDCEQTQFFRNIVAQDGKFQVEMDYAISHRYSISVSLIDKNGSLIKYYNVKESIGSGDPSTGFNQYSKGILSFITENYTLVMKLM